MQLTSFLIQPQYPVNSETPPRLRLLFEKTWCRRCRFASHQLNEASSVVAIDPNGRTSLFADTTLRRRATFRYADENLPAFGELESAIRLTGNCIDGSVPLSKLDAVWNRGQGRRLCPGAFFSPFRCALLTVHSPGQTK